MVTLHEMAIKLQDFVIQQQSDSHNSAGLNIHKYNNLKLRMDTMINYPHIIISIGISEATYNIKENSKVEGGLGSDEKYVRKWLSKSTVIENLMGIYLSLTDLSNNPDEAEEETPQVTEAKATGIRSSMYQYHNRRPRTLISASEEISEKEDESEDKNGVSLQGTSLEEDILTEGESEDTESPFDNF